ncbi:MAG: hypothetical protein AAFY34_09925 [Pseudomonadota bacterium]
MTNTQPTALLVAKTGPRIYVACLAADNSSHLNGVQIDTIDPDTIGKAVTDMLARGPISNAAE